MSISPRPALRRFVPAGVRWRIRHFSRVLQDFRSGVRLAQQRGDPAEFPHLLCRYECPLICYPGQQARFAGKRHNIQLATQSVDRLVVAPGETFSFWRCVGRPTRRAGYGPAAALKQSILTEDVGGAICLVSTLLYNVGLLSGMAIVERSCHSVDSYGNNRYFELGRDASVEFAYRDLRYRNDIAVPLILRTQTESDTVIGEAWSPVPLAITVSIQVEPPQYEPPPRIVTVDPTLETGSSVLDDPGLTGVCVRTRRVIAFNDKSRLEDLELSVHAAQPRRERVGPSSPNAGGRFPS